MTMLIDFDALNGVVAELANLTVAADSAPTWLGHTNSVPITPRMVARNTLPYMVSIARCSVAYSSWTIALTVEIRRSWC